MAISANLGFPRIGAQRELKKAVEAYWSGKSDQKTLLSEAKKIREYNWKLQKEAGIQLIPSNDFTFYDHMLDTAVLIGAVPSRYHWSGGQVDLDTFFAMARGRQGTTTDGQKIDVAAMEMTKWFDTNYHYIVPELHKGQKFKISSEKPFQEFEEAKALGIVTKPVLVGPVTFLKLSKAKDEGLNVYSLLSDLVSVYCEVISRLAKQGAEWIQLDEPCLALDLTDEEQNALKAAYPKLKEAAGSSKILLATYFEELRENLSIATSLPVDALHVDAVRGANEIEKVISSLPKNLMLSVGIVDGRNIWKNNFEKSLEVLKKAVSSIGQDRLIVTPSCSLLHTPVDLDQEKELDDELKNWLSFAKQKCKEITVLTAAISGNEKSVSGELANNKKAHESRSTSKRIHNDGVKKRVQAITEADAKRHNLFSMRAEKQHQKLGLPLFPSTTIGSFPQTPEIRKTRRAFKDGKIDQATYTTAMQKEIQAVVKKQEEIGLDVLVHGEPERNDMVEYFGEQLAGFAFTKYGWVQSYGSRCVKPPIIFGDVSRPKAMTVEWSTYAQSLTKKPMKGMLTGPVTILQWSFVRDDQPRSETTKQIALAIRDEVVDLEKAGIGVIQIDEPAIREGLPLRRSDWNTYLRWAVQSFRLSASGVTDETQIHTHMCYSEFNDIIEAIGAMDADVITIEASRSDMELLQAFQEYDYPNEIGPGVYDIHSPRIPSQEEMAKRLETMTSVIPPKQLWVNPDCGLKTRGWNETTASLKHMVEAGKSLREKFANQVA